MGRCGYSEYGYGYTVEEARRDAISAAKEKHGHEEGYSGGMNCSTHDNSPKCIEKPILSKTCKVEKTVQKGARKWETIFVIEPSWGGSYGQSKILRNSTQAKAIAEAKRMALENHKEYVVRIDKQLVQGNQKIATISPKKAKRGKWLFEGYARC